jgi:hypothetical protein
MASLKKDLEIIDTTGDVVGIVAEKLKIKTTHAKEFIRIALANAVLMDSKQQDYGSRNITKGGIFGCVLRASDKFERIFNLYEKRKGRAVNESIEDSFRDVSNYMIIALMLKTGRWPNE